MKIKPWFGKILKGASLGLGMIPGVSAGTMALIFGIYDILIDAVDNLRKKFGKSVCILFPYFLGALISSITVMVAVNYGYDYAPFAITCLFAGFIIGTLPLVTKDLKKRDISKKNVLLLLSAFVFAAAIGVLSVLSKLYWGFNLDDYFNAGIWWIYPLTFLSGFIAALACILPGISGAMILYIFGLYNPIVGFYVGADSMFRNSSKINIGLILSLVLIIGVLLGFVLTSKAMKSLMTKHHSTTFAVILGFLLGSVVSMFVNQSVIDDSTLLWMYQTAPLWELIIGPILFAVTILVFFFASETIIKKEGAKIEQEEMGDITQ
jgi:putative membrane protein